MPVYHPPLIKPSETIQNFVLSYSQRKHLHLIGIRMFVQRPSKLNYFVPKLVPRAMHWQPLPYYKQTREKRAQLCNRDTCRILLIQGG